MLNIADVVLIVFIALCIAVGIARGLVKSLFGLGSIVFSLVLALTLYPIVSGLLAQSPVGGFVAEQVEKIFGQEESASDNMTNASDTEEQEENQFLPDIIQSSVDGVTKQASMTVSEIALNIISMLIVFLLVRIILWVVAKLLDVATKLPVIHGCNKVLGGLFGAISGMLIVYVVLGLLAFTTLLNTTTDFGRTVQNSLFLSEMYENNILLYFLQSK